MTQEFCQQIAREAVFTCLSIAGPMLAFALVTGLLVGILQAVAQVHEMTLTFIPKIIAVAVALIVFMPWILSKMTGFSTFAFEKIATLGH
jgi:flagellar biosynthetic protein FliQ